MRPSRELLEYYRKKIGEYDTEKEEIIKKLDLFKQTLEDQHNLQFELRQKDDEISELQKAVSDMQVFLFQEREQVLKLYSENDRLKVFEIIPLKTISFGFYIAISLDFIYRITGSSKLFDRMI